MTNMKEMGTHFHVEIDEMDEMTADQLREALEMAGMKTARVEDAWGNHYGHLLTKSAISDIWQFETGAGDCQGTQDEPCQPTEGGPEHRKWEELSREQQDEFTQTLCSFYHRMRETHFIAGEEVSGRRSLKGVRMNPECGEPE